MDNNTTFWLIGGIVYAIVLLALIIGMAASMWKIFTKAGQPGWASLIPLYNFIVLLNIAGKPLWWIVFPPAGIFALAKCFGKGAGFGLGLVFLGFIFIPILGFGSARYIAPVTATVPVPATA
jgi:hypothetical protein